MALGDVFGIWLADHIGSIVAVIERWLNTKILPCDVYYVCDFPSDMYWSDVAMISVVAFLVCLCATIYPAWRAAGCQELIF